ncbi:hypothetical protein [Roseovarius sp.]|uniref:hypothetical protein n=1 Tax=Roseovarius sp. TaxID=1486281 RepID=UPI0026311169|nr:hypothetical protein [Roseovarius sp.]MDM8168509.1 hypothetical protein [Roseovarius sp.]
MKDVSMRLCFLVLLFLLPARVVLADTERLLGPFVIALPDDLQTFPGDEYGSDDLLNLMWKRELDPQRIAELRQTSEEGQFDDLEATIASGNTGNIILAAEPLRTDLLGMDAKEQHERYCDAFREYWGYGFSKFDQGRQIGHCASPVGAMTYVMCRYFERDRVCASGMDYIELLTTNSFTEGTFWTDMVDGLADPSSARAADTVLRNMAAGAAVDKVNDLLLRVRLRAGSE